MAWLTFFPAPGGQPVKRLRQQIHGTKKENLLIRRKKGVRIYKNGKIPEGEVYVPKLEPTAPIRLADRNHAHYPSRHCTILKKRRLNDGLPAHVSIHTGVIGRCLHVHLTHQIHDVADVFPRSRRATSQTVEAPNPWRQTREIINPKEKESQNINEWKNPRRASVRAETRAYRTDSPSRQKSRTLSITPLHHLKKTAQ